MIYYVKLQFERLINTTKLRKDNYRRYIEVKVFARAGFNFQHNIKIFERTVCMGDWVSTLYFTKHIKHIRQLAVITNLL